MTDNNTYDTGTSARGKFCRRKLKHLEDYRFGAGTVRTFRYGSATICLAFDREETIVSFSEKPEEGFLRDVLRGFGINPARRVERTHSAYTPDGGAPTWYYRQTM